MTLRSIASVLSGITAVSALSLAVGSTSSAHLRAGAFIARQTSDQDTTVTGVWAVRAGVFRGPWTVTLVQAGHALTGTIQQSFPVICATEPVAISDGALETSEDGTVVSFNVIGPSGGTAVFKGVVDFARGTIAFGRSSDTAASTKSLPRSVPPVPVRGRSVNVPAMAGQEDYAGFLSAIGEDRFVAHRLDSGDVASAQSAGCQIPETPTHGPEAAQFRRYVASAKVGFSPWTFDLTIANGQVSGTVTQGRIDSTTRMSTIVAGPFPISNGHASDTSIDFTIDLADGARVVTFHGTRSGIEAIAFTRRMTVVSVLSGADPGATGVFGAEGATRFTAVLDPSVEAPLSTPATVPVGSDEDTVSLDAVDARFAVARSGFAFAQYHVGRSFGGRLLLTVFDGAGVRVRQFEVGAAPGSHAAIWNLRADAPGAPDAALSRPLSAADVEVTASRAALASDLIRLAADDENGAARLAERLTPLLAGSDVGPAVGAGSYVCTLSRLDAGGVTPIATLSVDVRAGGGR